MGAGKYDRIISIERRQAGQDSHGEPNGVWAEHARRFANVRNAAGAERFASEQFVGKGATTFTIRWSSAVADLTVKDRVIYKSRTFDIVDVREIGRRHEIAIDATVRTETAPG